MERRCGAKTTWAGTIYLSRTSNSFKQRTWATGRLRDIRLILRNMSALWPRGCLSCKGSVVGIEQKAFLEFCHCPDILEIHAPCFSHAGSFWGISDTQTASDKALWWMPKDFLHWKWFIISNCPWPCISIIVPLEPLYWLHISFSSVEFLFGFPNDSSLAQSQWSPKVKDGDILIRSHMENKECNHSTHHFHFQRFAL